MVSEKQVDAFLYKIGEFAKNSITCFGPDSNLLKQHFKNVGFETDIGACVLCFSLIDDLVLNCLKSYMPNLTKNIERALFSNFGPLATASSRFTVAYSLGWISHESYEGIDKIRRIRNTMVHEVHNTTFSAPALTVFINAMHALQKENLERALTAAADASEEGNKHELRSDLRQRDLFLLNYFGLYGTLLVELSVFPVAQRFNVPTLYVVGDNLASLPEPIIKQRKEAIRAMLEIGLIKEERQSAKQEPLA
jgi:DNA-binding MltR family transcriptional regulator